MTEGEHGIAAFRDGLKIGCPEICNADQGAQFTSVSWIVEVTSHGVQISHTGVGRCIDNVRIERFWWTIKWKDIHLSSYETVSEARLGITNFIKYYNEERLYQALKYKTPYEVYFGRKVSSEDLAQKPLLSADTLSRRFITPSLSLPVKSAPLALRVTS